VGMCSSRLSSGACHMSATVTSFPHSKDAWWVLPLLPSPVGLFIYTLHGGCPAFRHLSLSKHTGGGCTTLALSGRLVYLQFTWRSAPPPTLVELSTQQPLLQVFPTSKVAGWVLPLLPSPAGLFIYCSCEGVPLPNSPELRAPYPLCYVFFFQLLVYYSVWFFFLFFPGQGSVCPGGYADVSQSSLWEYCVPLIYLRVCQAG
jgi:hypothetical protein